jgi:hypothetical protein
MSLRGESNDQREFDSTKQSPKITLYVNGLLRRIRLPFGRRTLLAMMAYQILNSSPLHRERGQPARWFLVTFLSDDARSF